MAWDRILSASGFVQCKTLMECFSFMLLYFDWNDRSGEERKIGSESLNLLDMPQEVTAWKLKLTNGERKIEVHQREQECRKFVF